MKEVFTEQLRKAWKGLSQMNKVTRMPNVGTGVSTGGVGVAIRRTSPGATIPTYAHEGDAGMDLYALEDTLIEPGETVIVPTGIAVAIPKGYELQIRPRSGVTVKTKLRVQLGTVDCTFRGAIGVIVDNTNLDLDVAEGFYIGLDGSLISAFDYFGNGMRLAKGSYIIRKGDRICQGVLAPVSHAHFTEVDSLDDSPRGGNGFGSTGVSE